MPEYGLFWLFRGNPYSEIFYVMVSLVHIFKNIIYIQSNGTLKTDTKSKNYKILPHTYFCLDLRFLAFLFARAFYDFGQTDTCYLSGFGELNDSQKIFLYPLFEMHFLSTIKK